MAVVLIDIESGIAEALRSALAAESFVEAPVADGVIAQLEWGQMHLDALVVGPEVLDPVDLVGHVHVLEPDVPALILTHRSRLHSLVRTVRGAPLVGANVRCAPVPSSNEDLVTILKEALVEARATVKRLDPESGPERRMSLYLGELLDHAPIGVMTVARDGRVLASNRRAEEMMGTTQVDVLGMELGNLFGDEGRIAELIDSCFSGRERSTQVFQRRGDGDQRVIEVTARAVRTTHGDRSAMLLLQDVTAKAAAEEGRRRALLDLALLSQATSMLATSLDYRAALEGVARLATTHLADWCTVHIAGEDGNLVRCAAAHRDPAQQPLLDALVDRYPIDPESSPVAGKAYLTGESVLLREVDDEVASRGNLEPGYRRSMQALGLTSEMAVPLNARDGTLGVIVLATGQPARHFEPEDLALAEEVARRAALAAENALLFQRVRKAEEQYRSMARTLLEGLLPPVLPPIEGLELASGYRPAGEGNEVGGDFYDVFETATGEWAFLIGDVCGKGAAAASLTGMARHTIRTAAMSMRRPSRVLNVLNDAIVRQEPERFCTIAYARIKPGRSGARLTVCVAGHPRPVVLRRNGDVALIGEPGIVLGVLSDPQLRDRSVVLGPGDAVVFVTDGVLDAGAPHSPMGEEGLLKLLRGRRGTSAADTVALIENAVQSAWENGGRDDCAILVLRVNEDPSGPAAREWAAG